MQEANKRFKTCTVMAKFFTYEDIVSGQIPTRNGITEAFNDLKMFGPRDFVSDICVYGSLITDRHNFRSDIDAIAVTSDLNFSKATTFFAQLRKKYSKKGVTLNVSVLPERIITSNTHGFKNHLLHSLANIKLDIKGDVLSKFKIQDLTPEQSFNGYLSSKTSLCLKGFLEWSSYADIEKCEYLENVYVCPMHFIRNLLWVKNIRYDDRVELPIEVFQRNFNCNSKHYKEILSATLLLIQMNTDYSNLLSKTWITGNPPTKEEWLSRMDFLFNGTETLLELIYHLDKVTQINKHPD